MSTRRRACDFLLHNHSFGHYLDTKAKTKRVYELLVAHKPLFYNVVPEAGVEPARPKAHASETCMSTSFITPASESTEGGNRTRTLLPELDFESSASTNSATSASVI